MYAATKVGCTGQRVKGRVNQPEGNGSVGYTRGRSIKSRRRRVQESECSVHRRLPYRFQVGGPRSQNLLVRASDRLIPARLARACATITRKACVS